MADREGQQVLLAIAADMQEAGALRRAQPFVAIAGVVGGADPADRQRQHARCVRAVDERIHTALGERAHQRLDREHETGRAGDMIDEREPGPLRHRREHGIDHLRRIDIRPRDRGSHDVNSEPLRRAQRIPAGVVRVVRREKLVSRAER